MASVQCLSYDALSLGVRIIETATIYDAGVDNNYYLSSVATRKKMNWGVIVKPIIRQVLDEQTRNFHVKTGGRSSPMKRIRTME